MHPTDACCTCSRHSTSKIHPNHMLVSLTPTSLNYTIISPQLGTQKRKNEHVPTRAGGPRSSLNGLLFARGGVRVYPSKGPQRLNAYTIISLHPSPQTLSPQPSPCLLAFPCHCEHPLSPLEPLGHFLPHFLLLLHLLRHHSLRAAKGFRVSGFGFRVSGFRWARCIGGQQG
jgi:hypothetical protein